MIPNRINCLLSLKDIELLKGIKDSEINMYSEVIDSKTTVVKLQCNDTVYFITNEPTEQLDGDEYPVLKLNTNLKYRFNSSFMLESAKLLNVYLIRDKLSWMRDGVTWEVEIDVGMRIITDKKEVVFLAMDSVAGLMKFTFGNDIETLYSECILREHWIFKSDTFIDLKRKQILIL